MGQIERKENVRFNLNTILWAIPFVPKVSGLEQESFSPESAGPLDICAFSWAPHAPAVACGLGRQLCWSSLGSHLFGGWPAINWSQVALGQVVFAPHGLSCTRNLPRLVFMGEAGFKEREKNMQGLLRPGLRADTVMEVVCWAAESHCKGRELKGAHNYDYQCYQW